MPFYYIGDTAMEMDMPEKAPSPHQDRADINHVHDLNEHTRVLRSGLKAGCGTAWTPVFKSGRVEHWATASARNVLKKDTLISNANEFRRDHGYA